jgi:hypothetical protein
VHEFGNDESDLLRNFHECYYVLSPLGSAIVYELLVQLVALTLRYYMF